MVCFIRSSKVHMIYIIMVVMILVTDVSSAASIKSSEVTCGEGQRKNTFGDCENCKSCGVGYGVKHLCTEKTPTECINCSTGYFSDQESAVEACYVCNTCERLGVAVECTPEEDATCNDCPVGTYLSLSLTCADCSPECGPNEDESVACGGEHDRVCIKKQQPSPPLDITSEAETAPQDINVEIGDTNNSPSKTNNNLIGQIIGGVVGGVGGVFFFFVGLGFFYYRKRKNQTNQGVIKFSKDSLQAIKLDQPQGQLDVETANSTSNLLQEPVVNLVNEGKMYLYNNADINLKDFKKFIRNLYSLTPNICQTDIDNIENENPSNTKEKKYQWLRNWHEFRGSAASCKELLEALEKAGLKNSAEKFQEQLDLNFGLLVS